MASGRVASLKRARMGRERGRQIVVAEPPAQIPDSTKLLRPDPYKATAFRSGSSVILSYVR